MIGSPDKQAWVPMREVQHGTPLKEAVPPLIGAHEILEMLPPSVRTEVSTKWVRNNIPGRVRIGRSYVWPSTKVIEFLSGGGLSAVQASSKRAAAAGKTDE